MARLCGLADEITRSRAIAGVETVLFSILLAFGMSGRCGDRPYAFHLIFTCENRIYEESLLH
ncbi:MAG TPA: hypothetical protein VES58_01740 [Syntrophobacteria bacterium]|nr:hypothetical protein [Syntrophobacteria bacterium]